MARFDNKVVLVSGGARGQGAAEARLLAARGAKVVIGAVLDNQGQSPAVELGPAASFVRHDVTSEADWARAVEAAPKLGGLHGLVKNKPPTVGTHRTSGGSSHNRAQRAERIKYRCGFEHPRRRRSDDGL
jgi:NAD(P)-dependent dehydrogenase (short-subunit alcohol dehydrogenase family)